MNIYIQPTTNELRTEVNLKMMGIATDDLNTLHALGWYEYVSQYPDYNKLIQYLEKDGEPVLQNGQYIQSYKVRYLPEEQIATLKDKLFTELRDERNKLLADTDYLVLDYPLTEEQLQEVKTYRQALRDLPNRDDAPFWEEIPWPTKPNFLEG